MNTRPKRPNVSRTVKQKVANPLDAMTSTPDNLLNLPIEIWHEIFTYATIAPSSSFDTTVIDSCTPLPTMMMWQQPDLLADFDSWTKPGSYGIRRDLTLVCKSWYFIANPILWKNLQIDLRWNPKVLQNLCSTLKKNHALTDIVVCVVIRGLEWVYSRTNTNIDKELEEELEKVVPFSKVFPKMKRLKMLQCPRSILEMVDWDMKMEIVMVYEKVNRPIRGGELFFGSHCWQNCHTLVVTHIATSLFPRAYKSATIVFPNLLNLRIRVDNDIIIDHITTYWNLPRLRNLSVTSTGTDQWTKVLERVRLTIETLGLAITIPPSVIYPQPCPTTTMPNLSTLCLQDGPTIFEGGATLWWLSHIIAPQLGRIVFHPTWSVQNQHPMEYLGPYYTPFDQAGHLRQKVKSALESYPTLKKVGVVIEHHHVLDTDENKRMGRLVLWEDVIGWCEKGVVIETIEQSTGETRRFTLDDFKLKGLVNL